MYISYYSSPVGLLKISAAEDHILSVQFCDNMEEPDHTHYLVQNCIEQLDAYFKGTLIAFNLPLKQTGTPFQQKVWAQLCSIPYGKTISYLSLSKALGDTKAIRAVGTANGRNQIAIIVPCHRVIGSNFKLVGYAGGLWRKKWLLEHEAKHFAGVQTLPF